MVGGKTPTSQLEALRKLGLSEEEIADVLATDKEIDRGAKLFELDPELEAGAKKARQADRTDTPKKANREKKIDKDKLFLMDCICRAIPADTDCPNPERECLFTYNGKKYKIVLSCPRS